MNVLEIILFTCPLMAQTTTTELPPFSLSPSNLIAVEPSTPAAFTAPSYLGSPPKDYAKKSDGHTLYRWSLATVAAANAADTLSSWHRPEASPFLAGPGSNFDARSMVLKSAFIGTSLLIERWALHHNPRLYRSLAWLNFGISGALGGVAAHNMTLH